MVLQVHKHTGNTKTGDHGGGGRAGMRRTMRGTRLGDDLAYADRVLEAFAPAGLAQA